jgi:hypothetical protein
MLTGVGMSVFEFIECERSCLLATGCSCMICAFAGGKVFPMLKSKSKFELMLRGGPEAGGI